MEEPLSGRGGWVRPPHEFNLELREQLAALQASCTAYDKGDHWEAKRIANALSILLDSRGQTVCLLDRVGLLQRMQLVSSEKKYANLQSQSSVWFLIKIDLTTGPSGSSATYVPLLDEALTHSTLKPYPFDVWWNRPVLKEATLGAQQGRELSRKDIIRSTRDQDGGAHVDGRFTNEAYVAFARQNAVGFSIIDGKGTRLFDDSPQPATIRQVGWELLYSYAAMAAADDGE